MRSTQIHPRFPPLVFAIFVASACGSDDPMKVEDVAPPTMAEVAGDYSATEFSGGGYDVLALEGSLDLTLGADGSLAGSMYIPPAADGPYTFDMAGTYTLSGLSLTFYQDADTFVRDATWTWKGDGVIEGFWSGSGTTASVTLER